MLVEWNPVLFWNDFETCLIFSYISVLADSVCFLAHLIVFHREYQNLMFHWSVSQRFGSQYTRVWILVVEKPETLQECLQLAWWRKTTAGCGAFFFSFLRHTLFFWLSNTLNPNMIYINAEALHNKKMSVAVCFFLL